MYDCSLDSRLMIFGAQIKSCHFNANIALNNHTSIFDPFPLLLKELIFLISHSIFNSLFVMMEILMKLYVQILLNYMSYIKTLNTDLMSKYMITK